MNKIECISKQKETDAIGKSNIQGMVFIVEYSNGEEVSGIFSRLSYDGFNLISFDDGNRFLDQEDFKNVETIQGVCKTLLNSDDSISSVKYYKKSTIIITQTE